MKHGGSIQYSNHAPHVGFYESLIEALLHACYRHWRQRPLVMVITFSLQNPCFMSPRLGDTIPLSLSLPLSLCAIYLFYMNSPSYICCVKFPLISTHFLGLLSPSFPQPTFQLSLWGVILNDGIFL